MSTGQGEAGAIAAGARAGVPFALASLIVGLSFGVLARPVMGPTAAIVMSIIVFAGSAQFAALAVLVMSCAAIATALLRALG